MALLCLGSLLERCQEPVRLHLHNDGTLEPQDLVRLNLGLPGVRIISKEEADDKMEIWLKSRPASRRLREHYPHIKKVLDCVVFNDSPTFVCCDADVLFLRPFANLFRLPADTGAVFMTDIEHCYSVRSWNLMLSNALKLPQRANVGLVCFRRRDYDPDLIEWFLTKKQMYGNPFFVEQTIWGLLGWRIGCRLWDPEQVAIVTPDWRPNDRLCVGHFVGRSRHLLKTYSPPPVTPSSEVVREFRTLPTSRCRPMDMAVCEAKRVMGRPWLGLLPR
jgi:hypothetical protein